MQENTQQPPNGHRNVKFNPKPTMPKPNALKTKNTSNIQAIELNILNKFYQKESFEIFKQAKFEDEQLIKYFLFQFQFWIVIKSGLEGTIAFHK
jgi:hypothetical protein